MSISDSDVQHIAALARVGLHPDRIPSLVAELNGILGHMDVLQQVDAPSDHGHETEPNIVPSTELRSDAVHSASTNLAMAHIAPEFRDGFFLVPRLSTHGAFGGAEGDDDTERA